ncbi:Uncharacterised protein [uncultured archaeon]|nr:Uncharacterised protein [uncultured archaeon]
MFRNGILTKKQVVNNLSILTEKEEDSRLGG